MKESTRRKREGRSRAQKPAAGGFFASAWKPALVVFLAAFALYAGTIGHDFVWDDGDLIVDNPAIRTLDGATLRSMFLENFWSNIQRAGGYYRPLVTLSYHIDYRVHGLDPHGFHLSNVILNAIACALAFLLLRLLSGNTVLGFVAALLFTVHPIHTENVAWVAGRTDLLAALWMFASLILYLLARRGRTILLAPAMVAFMLALLSKESAACLPLIVALIEFGPFAGLATGAPDARERGPGRAIAVTIAFLAVTAAYLLLRRHALGVATSSYDAYASGPALPLSILAGYVVKLLFPLRLSGEYDAPVPAGLLDPHALVGLAVLVIIGLAVVRYRRKQDVVLGFGILLLGLTPVLNIVPLGEISAERFLYIPSLGFALLLGSVFTGALGTRYPAARSSGAPGVAPALAGPLTVLLLFTLGAYAVRTVTRNADWRNEDVLFAKTAATTPGSTRALLGVGRAAERRGDIAAAAAAYQKALEINPDYPDALSNLAGIYARQGRVDEARQMIERALRAAPNHPRLMSNLGTLYSQEGRLAEAAQQFENVLAINPGEREARFNLALVRFHQQDYAAAKTNFEKVAGQGERFDLAFYYLAVIEDGSGNRDRARQLAAHFLSVYRNNDAFRSRAQAIAGR